MDLNSDGDVNATEWYNYVIQKNDFEALAGSAATFDYEDGLAGGLD